MIGPGTIPVRIEVVGSGADKISLIKDSLDYTLQLGSFSVLENARQLRDRVASTVFGRRHCPLEHQHEHVLSCPTRTIFYSVQCRRTSATGDTSGVSGCYFREVVDQDGRNAYDDQAQFF